MVKYFAWIMVLFLLVGMVNATDYYFSQSGSDASSTGNITNPWKTIAKFNLTNFTAGDNIYFNRGDVWRLTSDARFDLDSGNSSGNITYSSYGTGELPIFYGSYNYSGTGQWNCSSSLCNSTGNLSIEIGLIIINQTSYLNRETGCSLVNAQGDWCYNTTTDRVTIYSATNPATAYGGIELAEETHLLDFRNENYTIIEKLHFTSGARHGLFTNTVNWSIVRDCQISWIGGGYYTGTSALGNCIEYNHNSTNVLVTRNNISQCYDEGITFQGNPGYAGSRMFNLTASYNIVTDSGYGISAYNCIDTAYANCRMADVLIDHNTLINSGRGFGYSSGRAMLLSRAPINTSNVVVTNNIFYNSSYRELDLGRGPATNQWLGQSPTVNYNLYFDGSSNHIYWNTTSYSNVSAFTSATGKELNGLQVSSLTLTDYQLPSGHVACTMSSTGSYVGALPCASATPITVSSPVTSQNITRYLTVNFTSFNTLHNHRISLNDSTILKESTLYEVSDSVYSGYLVMNPVTINFARGNLVNRTTFVCDEVNVVYWTTSFVNYTYSDGTSNTTRTDSEGGGGYTLHDVSNPYPYKNVTSINITAYHSHISSVSCGAFIIYNLTNNNSIIIDLYQFNKTVGEYMVNVTGFNSTTNITSGLSGKFNITRNALFNVSVLSYLGSVVPFTINLSGEVKSGNGSVTFDVIKDNLYNINTSASGFSSNHTTQNITHFGTFYKNITLLANNSLNLSIYNIATLGLITQNITVVVTGSTVRTFSTVSGNILITNVESGYNEVKMYNQNFTESRYSVEIVEGTSTFFSGYLNPVSTAQNVTFTFYDLNGAVINGVWLYQYTLTNTSMILSMARVSDISGKVYFNYVPTSYYYYNISSTEYQGAPFILNPPVEPNYDITLTPLSDIPSYDVLNITGSHSFNNVTSRLTLSYTSSESNISSYKFYTYVGNSLVCLNTSSALSSAFVCDLAGREGVVSIYGTGDNVIFYGATLELPGTSLSDLIDIKEASFFSGLLALILIIAGATINIFVALVFGVIALLVVYWIGIFDVLSTLIITVVVVASITIAFVIRRRY